MFTVFVYADVVDTRSGHVSKGACIQQFKAQGNHLADAIDEGEEHAFSLSDLHDNVEFAVWNERSRSIDFRGRPNRIIYDTKASNRT